jgi:lipopolysaccharide export system permease protein
VRRLDLYVGGRFASMIASAVGAFVVVFICVDAFEHFSRWVDRDIGIGTFARYYMYGLPYIVVLVMPVAVLLSSLFLVHSLARRSELVAMTCAGVSVQRTFAPLLAVGLAASVLVMVLGDSIVSEGMYRQSVVKRVEIEGHEPVDYSRRGAFSYRTLDGSFLEIGYFDGRTGVITGVSMFRLDDSSRVAQRIDAGSMSAGDGGWTARGVTVRSFGPGGAISVERADSIPVPWLRETPLDFAARPQAPQEMSFLELAGYIRRVEAAGGDTRGDLVELWLKLFYPLSNFIMVLVGAPLATRNPRSGKAAGFGLAILLAFLFFSLLRFGQTLGHKGALDPVLAAGLADGFFILVGAGLLFRPATS